MMRHCIQTVASFLSYVGLLFVQPFSEGGSSRPFCFITLTPLTFTIVLEYGRLSGVVLYCVTGTVPFSVLVVRHLPISHVNFGYYNLITDDAGCFGWSLSPCRHLKLYTLFHRKDFLMRPVNGYLRRWDYSIMG